MSRGRVEIVGALGTGKTTLVREIERASVAPEIECRYEDITRLEGRLAFWKDNEHARSFFIQSVFYLHFLDIMRQTSSDLVVVDCSLLYHHMGYSAIMSQNGLLKSEEFEALTELASALSSILPPIVGIIHCEAPDHLVAQRIIERGRDDDFTQTIETVTRLRIAAHDCVKRAAVPSIHLDCTQPFGDGDARLSEVTRYLLAQLSKLSK